MKFNVSEDLKRLVLVESTQQEFDYLKAMLTVQLEQFKYAKAKKNMKFKYGNWDGRVCYLTYNKFIDIGLWQEIVIYCQKVNTKIEIDGLEQIFDFSINFEDFENWVYTTFPSNFMPRNYQIESAFKVLISKRCTIELATGAGKTLVTFLVFAYLLHLNKLEKFLLIVPNVSLVLQAIADFNEYLSKIKVKLPFKFEPIHEGFKILTNDKELSEVPKYKFVTKQQFLDFEKVNVFVGTYQSLIKLDKTFLDKFTTVACDEAHTAKANTIQTIFRSCIANRRFGVTGTIPKDVALKFAVFSQTGPTVALVSSKQLIEEGHISDIEINVLKLKWQDKSIIEDITHCSTSGLYDGAKLLNLEKNIVKASQKRIDLIVKIANKLTKNSLFLFQHIEYGNWMYDQIRQHTNKQVLYIDGSVDKDIREELRGDLETGSDKILIASYGTFSTGINVKNIHNIVFCESYKSEVLIRQSIGRGLRLHGEKDKLKVYDIVDDLSENGYVNMLLKHSKERIKIYKEQHFSFTINEIIF